MSWGAPWDFKANAGDDVNDGGIPERADAPAHQRLSEKPSCIVATHRDGCRERTERET